MANPRPTQKDQISSNTRDKALVAKSYIEQKYSKRKETENARHEEWAELSQKMQELNLDKTEQSLIKQEILRSEAAQQRQKRQKVSILDFEPIKVIGKGAFGEVRVVRHKQTGKILAMKRMNKSEMTYKNQIQHVKAERDLLTTMDNRLDTYCRHAAPL